MLSDSVVSLIRTVVPVGVGAGLAWLAGELGVVLDGDQSAGVTAAAVAVATAVYYAAARKLEQRWPWFGVLLGKRQQPTYQV